MRARYRIIRVWRTGRAPTLVADGLTLDQANAHVANPDTMTDSFTDTIEGV
jgi:hypothetical protein